VNTAVHRIARIVCAKIAIIAANRISAQALPILTAFAHDASIAIIARSGNSNIDAPFFWQTRIGRTRIHVVTRNVPRATAGTIFTVVRRGALVTIVARHFVRFVDAARICLTAISCADISVVTIDAVPTTTLSFLAGIPKGAGIPVTTEGPIVGRLKFTPAVRSAHIVCAGIVVVTLDGITFTDTLRTMVGHGARLSIVAGGAVEQLIDATLRAGTGVTCARIPVVTEKDIGPIYQIGLVGFTVTVVVNPVAAFGRWMVRRTIREALFTAGPLTRTRSEFVGHLTGRR